MKNKITIKSMLSDIMGNNPNAAKILFEQGLMCMGCPIAMQETLEQGCKAHGMSKKEIDALIKKLNK